MLLIVGIIFAVILADKVGRIWLQVLGFIGCAAGLLLASFSDGSPKGHQDRGDLRRLHAVQLHDQPGPERADLSAGGRSVPDGDSRHGRRASRRRSARSARSRPRSCFPILLTGIGTGPLLYILVATSILGAVVTWLFRIETNGVSLDEIGQ
jgi:putative MFS transporter